MLRLNSVDYDSSMKKALFRISLCVVAVIIGYGGCWFYAAHKFQRSLITEVGDYLQYDSISYTGFPFKIGLKVKNPICTEGKISTIGDWEVGTTLFGDTAWLAVSGKTTLQKEGVAVSGKVHVQVLNWSNYFKVFTSFKEGSLGYEPDWFSSISPGGFNVHFENLALFLKGNTEPLYMVDSFSFGFAPVSEKNPYTKNACFNSDLKGLRTDEEQLSMLRHQKNEFFPWRLAIDNFALKSYFRLLDAKENIRVLLELERCHLAHRTLSSELIGNIGVNVNGSTSSVSLALNLSGEAFKPSEKDLFTMRQEIAEASLQQAKSNSLAVFSFFNNHPDAANELLLHLSPSGPFAHQIDLDVEASLEKNVLSSTTCHLKRFHTTVPGNEIDMKGYFSFPEMQQTPFLELHISNPDMVSQYWIETYQQIRKLVMIMQPEYADEVPPVNQRFVGKVRQFIDSLSLEKDRSKWHFIIRGNRLSELSFVPYDQNTFLQKAEVFISELSNEFPSVSQQKPVD